MSRARSSAVWNYFTVDNVCDKKAVCNYCKKTLSYKSTITNLKLHLKQKHLSVYEEFCRSESGRTTGNVNIVNNNNNLNLHGTNIPGGSNAITSSSASSASALVAAASVTVGSVAVTGSKSPPRKVPRLVSTYLNRKVTSHEKANIDNCLLKMITKDFQPFNIVNDEGFRAYSHALNPSYEIPSRRTLADRLLAPEYENKLAAVKNKLQNFCLSICLTVDCWTSRSMEPYIAVTGHYLHSETLEFTSVLIQCSALEGSHTSVNISEELKNITESWGITDKVNFLVTDNATNMVHAATMLGWNHFGCYVHNLNLIVQEGLAIPEIEPTISKIQKTVAHFKRSSLAKEKLLKYQINAQNIQQNMAKTVVISVPTRWNSVFLMLQRFSELQEALRATIPNLSVNLPIIPIEEWRCIDQVIEVLKPFYEVTEMMSAEKYLTASKALVVTQGLINIYCHLEKQAYYGPVCTLIQSLKNSLNKRFKDIEHNQNIALCTYLDPRFKQHAFADKDALATIECVLVEKASELAQDDVADASQQPENPQAQNPLSLSIWLEFDLKVQSIQTPKLALTKAMEEIDLYKKEGIIARTNCPLKWWLERKALYPILYLLFTKTCNIVITSVPCERAFSKSGYLISDRRTRLTSSKVSQIMFLNSN